jgi:hypothetical protein
MSGRAVAGDLPQARREASRPSDGVREDAEGAQGHCSNIWSQLGSKASDPGMLFTEWLRRLTDKALNELVA